MSKLKKLIGLRTIKTAIGAALAVFIAQLLNLNYGINAGIVVILSLQNTRKKSFQLAAIRISATFFALIIGAIVFSVFGFSALAFGIYLLLFIPFAARFRLNDGIVPASVLVSHLLGAKDVSFASLSNEMAQMIIGAGIALVLNIYMPGLEKSIREDIKRIKSSKLQLIDIIYRTLEGEEIQTSGQMIIDEIELRISNSLERLEFDKNEYTIFNLSSYILDLERERKIVQSLSYLYKLSQRISLNNCEVDKLLSLTKEFRESQMEESKASSIIENIDNYSMSLEILSTKRDKLKEISIVYQYLEELREIILQSSDNFGKNYL